MTATASAVSMKSARRMPGEVGAWLFIFGDMVMFAMYFTAVLLARAGDAEMFAASQAQLSQALGLINTLLMLTSSWFVAMALRAARNDNGVVSRGMLLSALACGAAFGIVKFIEWGGKFDAGITVNSNAFFTYYFILTGIHLVHVLMGMSVLIFLIRHLRVRGLTAGSIRNLESGAAFWHLVDLLWIMLFAVLYLIF